MLHFWIGSNCISDVIFRRLHFWIYDEPNQTRMLNKNFGLRDKKLRLLVNMRILSNIFVESNKWLKLVPYISVRESVFAFISWKSLQKLVSAQSTCLNWVFMTSRSLKILTPKIIGTIEFTSSYTSVIFLLLLIGW